MGRKLNDLTGRIFGELEVISLFEKRSGRPTTWSCLCSCGEVSVVQAPRLLNGKTKSCGHIKITHNMTGSPTYKSWNAMKQRCLNPSTPNYKKYGALGITVCDKWLTFEGFYADMGERPEGTSLNRKAGASIYSKETCEWATTSVQSYDQMFDPRNRSGVKGVRWRKERSVWEARISQGEQHLLYYGSDFFEAVCCRKSAELKFYGFGR